MSLLADIPDVDDASDLWRACESFRPSPEQRLREWAIENVTNEFGRPYDDAQFPHHGAPGGPMDAYDDPRVREISLQWGTRLGKTFFAQAALLHTADVDPGPMMHASSVEKLAKECAERLYKMIRVNRRLAAKLIKPRREQRQDLIEFAECQIYVAWSRSTSTLSDKSIKVGHAGEYDKWEHPSTSKEAHPHKLYDDRFKDFWQVRKEICEGTPTVRDRSPIEDKRCAGTNCRYEVPCPHCRDYQRLEMGDARTWGVRWDAGPDGRSDASIAHATGHYVCRHCASRIDDHVRPWMMRRGVWCPEGCTVDSRAALKLTERMLHKGERPAWRGWKHATWIDGTPTRDGVAASYHLSSLYALALGWGDVAKEFVESKDRPQKLRNFVNQWLGDTWAIRKSASTADLVAQRLKGTQSRGAVPSGATFLVVAADRQQSDGGFVVYTVLAGGPDERAWTVDYGTLPSLAALWETVCRKPFPHADGGPPLVPLATVIDSGFRTKETYDFCNTHAACLACKGSSSDLGGAPYRLVKLSTGTRTGAVGQILFEVATDYWETELSERLDNRLAEQPGSLTLCTDAARDQEFLAQLLNAAMEDVVDKRGNAKLLWVKRHESLPNDFRDATRYGLALMRALVDDQGGVPDRHRAGIAGAAAPADEAPRSDAGGRRRLVRRGATRRPR